MLPPFPIAAGTFISHYRTVARGVSSLIRDNSGVRLPGRRAAARGPTIYGCRRWPSHNEWIRPSPRWIEADGGGTGKICANSRRSRPRVGETRRMRRAWRGTGLTDPGFDPALLVGMTGVCCARGHDAVRFSRGRPSRRSCSIRLAARMKAPIRAAPDSQQVIRSM